jgi:hypothetical protein
VPSASSQESAKPQPQPEPTKKSEPPKPQSQPETNAAAEPAKSSAAPATPEDDDEPEESSPSKQQKKKKYQPSSQSRSVDHGSTPECFTFEDAPGDAGSSSVPTYFKFFRMDDAGSGHLYHQLSAENEPEIPMKEGWQPRPYLCGAENTITKGIEYLFRALACMMYPVAVLMMELMRFLGIVVLTVVVRPFMVLTELVLKPLMDLLFSMSQPAWKLAQAMAWPVLAAARFTFWEIGRCFSGVLASLRSGKADRFDDLREVPGLFA